MSIIFQSLVIRYGRFIFKYRNALFPLVLIALLILFTPGPPYGRGEFWLDMVGLAVASVGQLVHVAVVGLTPIKRGGVNKRLHADGLLTTGAFAYCRNPLYVGNLLILCGLFIIYNNRWVYLFGGLFFLSAYGAIVAAEEAFLSGQYGTDYREYCQRVKRWWPSWTGASHTVQEMPMNWRRVIADDYFSVYNWMVVAILLLSDKAWLGHHARVITPESLGLGITFVVLTLGRVLVRHFKHRGVLPD